METLHSKSSPHRKTERSSKRRKGAHVSQGAQKRAPLLGECGEDLIDVGASVGPRGEHRGEGGIVKEAQEARIEVGRDGVFFFPCCFGGGELLPDVHSGGRSARGSVPSRWPVPCRCGRRWRVRRRRRRGRRRRTCGGRRSGGSYFFVPGPCRVVVRRHSGRGGPAVGIGRSRRGRRSRPAAGRYSRRRRRGGRRRGRECGGGPSRRPSPLGSPRSAASSSSSFASASSGGSLRRAPFECTAPGRSRAEHRRRPSRSRSPTSSFFFFVRTNRRGTGRRCRGGRPPREPGPRRRRRSSTP
mmetsp:Transcript_195/g.717  ORF Transcript_195/g.717 Transcript_195/m.717 type:complete len:299 (-) Transcript_195:467-1363(-)